MAGTGGFSPPPILSTNNKAGAGGSHVRAHTGTPKRNVPQMLTDCLKSARRSKPGDPSTPVHWATPGLPLFSAETCFANRGAERLLVKP